MSSGRGRLLDSRLVFNLSGSEVIFILLAALVVLGPEKLPGAIRQVGRIYSELRKMGHGFQSEMRAAFDEPMRELRETADLAKNSVMKPLGDEGPNLADVKPRSISESVRKMLEGSDGPATAAEVAAASEQAAPVFDDEPVDVDTSGASVEPVGRATAEVVSDPTAVDSDADGQDDAR